MNIAIMQPYLLPYIGYFQLMKEADVFVVLDDVNFIKKGWVNRNRILSKSGELRFTLNLIGASQNKLINEIEIGDNRAKLKNSIAHSYAKAPMFKTEWPQIEAIFDHNENNLSAFITHSLRLLRDRLNLTCDIVTSSEIEQRPGVRAQEKIIGLCQALDGKRYINAAGGMELYERSVFEDNEIDLNFLKSTPKSYQQFHSGNEFVPFLSIIDPLMFLGEQQLVEQINSYELVKK